MKAEGFTHIDELQSYMIKRVEKFLNGKGRTLIGWDEIMEGGLAPEATVMSWQSEAGGIKAARMGHDVVMVPTSYLYFDYYQADPPTQPFAIGGYVPIKRVYSFNPAPVDSLTAAESKHILGLQANTWTEYMPNEAHVEYMVFPRMLALAETGWTPQEKRNWDDFKIRMNAQIPLLKQMGINAFQLSDEIEATMTVDTIRKEIKVTLDAEKYPVEIRYTIDGSTPTPSASIYDAPIVVNDSAHIVAVIFRDGKMQGTPVEKKVDYHRGINKPIHYNSQLSSKYMAGGMNALLNGYRGGLTYMDGLWQGYTNDLDCVIDMGEVTDIHKVSARFMQLIWPQVFQPGQVELFTSNDGINFTAQGIVPTTIPNDDKDLSFQEYAFHGDWKARYIRLVAKEANGGSFIFTDEIVIW
jgi:hexosaminidase